MLATHGEGGCHGLARVALDIQTVEAPAQVAVHHVNTAFLRAGRLAPVRRPGYSRERLVPPLSFRKRRIRSTSC